MSDSPANQTRVGRDVRTVSGLTLASRVTGLLRDSAMARVFGAGAVGDAFFFAFMIPNLFRRLFGEGALSAAFLPVYARLFGEAPEAGRRLGRQVLGGMLLVVASAVLVLELLLLAASFAGGDGLALRLSMLLLPYAPFVCAVAVLGAMLQVHGRFGPTAAMPLLLNGLVILALLVPARHFAEDRPAHAQFVALAVLLAGCLQVAWSVAAVRSNRERSANRPAPPPEPELRRVVRDGAADVRRHVIPMVIGLGALQIGTLLDGLIAGWPSIVGPEVMGIRHPLEPGAMTAITLGQRLYQFPLGVFGIAIATAVFPLLARRASDGDLPGVRDTVREGLRLVGFIGLPAAVGLALVARPLVIVLFEGGEFDAADTVRVAPIAVAYGLGVASYSAVHVLARAFYALERPGTPVRTALVALSVSLVLNLILIWTPLKEAGLAAATAIGSTLQVVLLLRALAPVLGERIIDGPTRASIRRTLLMTLAMGVVVQATDLMAGLAVESAIGGWLGAAVRLAILVVVGGGTFGGLAMIVRAPELRALLGGRAE